MISRMGSIGILITGDLTEVFEVKPGFKREFEREIKDNKRS
jgi:hypothetical protein